LLSFILTYAHVYTCIFTYNIHIYIHTGCHLHIHNTYTVHINVHIYIYTYIHMHIQYTYTHITHTDIHSQVHMQTYRHTDRHTYIHIYIHKKQTNNIRICLYKGSSKNRHLGINMFPPCCPPFCGAILNLGTFFVFFLVWTVLRSQQQCISQVLFFLSTANRWHGLLSWKDRQCLFWWNVLLKSHRSARKYHSSLPFGPDSWLS
jgi:hypothetical protein